MIAVAAVPLLIGLVLSAGAGPLARRLEPSLAVRLLTALALTVALSTGLVLSAAAVLVCAQLGPLPRLGQWSVASLRARSEIPDPIGLLALAVVVVCLSAAILRAGRSMVSVWRASRIARSMQPAAGDLVLIDDDVPIAYAVGGAPGRIVVSTSMLRALSAPERAVLMAHEAAHLQHRHYLYLHLARLAAAANPLLRRTAAAVAYSIERWADEDAARAVGDRRLAGQALARAALARTGHAVPSAALAATDLGVAERVLQLLRPPTDHRPAPIALVAVAGVASWVAAGLVVLWANNVIQVAETVYLRH
jgi:Peptidase family M48